MSNERRWMSCELNKVEADAYRIFCKQKGIKYEPSQCGDLIHFETYVNDVEVEMLDNFVDSL